MMINRPNKSEYDSFFEGYVSLIDEEDVLLLIKEQQKELRHFFENLPEDKISFAYADGKWTVKQVLRHMIDAERVFGYRVMCLARGDKTNLPGFSEKDYQANAMDEGNSFENLVKEFDALRTSNISLINNLNKASYVNQGRVNNSVTSTSAAIFILVGHAAHHYNILKERYL